MGRVRIYGRAAYVANCVGRVLDRPAAFLAPPDLPAVAQTISQPGSVISRFLWSCDIVRYFGRWNPMRRFKIRFRFCVRGVGRHIARGALLPESGGFHLPHAVVRRVLATLCGNYTRRTDAVIVGEMRNRYKERRNNSRAQGIR